MVGKQEETTEGTFAEQEKTNKEPSLFKNPVFQNIMLVILVMCATIGIRAYAVELFKIPSASMENTLIPEDIVLVNKLDKNIHRGDIVVFNENTSGQIYIKRVIGLPGDTIELKDQRVYVNGNPLDEDYTIGETFNSINRSHDEFLSEEQKSVDLTQPIKIPSNSYWLMGDNREDSRDSRFFGPVSSNQIIGKAIYRVAPIDRFGEIEQTESSNNNA